MRVWIYEEREYGELGAERYTVEWHTVRPGYNQAEHEESPDPDRDIISHMKAFPTLAEARVEGKRIYDAGLDYYGAVIIQRQRVEWMVEEDGVATWESVGFPEYIDE